MSMVRYPFRYIVFLKFLLIAAPFRRRNASVWGKPAARGFRPSGLIAALSIALLLPACAGDSPSASSQPMVTIGFVEGTPTPTIEVFSRGRPLAGAVLIEPSGRQTAAPVIERDTVYADPYGYGYGPSVGVGAGGGSWNGGSWRGGGIGLGMPLGGGAAPQPVQTSMRARIAVPNMAFYRANWEKTIVRVTFGTDPANNVIADIPAPAPGGR
jgi:hypothetical protein